MTVPAVEIKRSALEIELRALFVTEAVKEADESNYYCVTVVDSKNRTWFGTCEGTSRGVLRSIPGDTDGDEVLFTDMRREEDGSRYTLILLDHLKDIEVYGRLYLTAATQDDHDVKGMMELIDKEVQIKIELPTDPEAYVSRIEYLVAIKHMLRNLEDKEALLCFDTETQMVCEIKDINYRQSMMGPYLSVNTTATMLFSNTLVDVASGAEIWPDRWKVGQSQLLPATAEQIAVAAEKGKKLFNEFCNSETGFVHKQYEGNTYTQGPWGERIRKFTKSRVVVDPKGCQQFDTAAFRSLTSLEGLNILTNDDDEIKGTEVINEAKYAQVQPFLILFNLTTSRWATGNVNLAKPVNHRTDAFEKVILADDRKRLVRALTTRHSLSGGEIDIIDGKGGGMLFLLDGAPGTGKTLTAEATAEELSRVLYKVSLGELGSDVSKLEKTLTQILALAERWNAVLLIDEADVFLEKRSSENLARNAVVAVFLRLLEYFNGLLFMTTNRGDNLDEAFLSRVTLGLHFKKPTRDDQIAIWKGLLHNAGINLKLEEIDKLVAYNVNGREVKNAINTGKALAEYDGGQVLSSHIEEVLKARKTFHNEIKESQR